MTKQFIQAKLSPYHYNKKLVTYNQDVKDIIKGIKKTHEQYKSEYDKIANYFVEDTALETAESIFQFLKLHVPYKAESEHEQTLRSPSAILAYPADCKSYSLFAGGVLDALNRMGYEIPFAYRFANYTNFSREGYEHVYIVLYPGEDEIILDAVPDEFNVEKTFYIHTDVNYKPMALYKVNGLPVQVPASVQPLNTFSYLQAASKMNGCGCGNGATVTGAVDTYIQAFGGVIKQLNGNSILNAVFGDKWDTSTNKWKSRVAKMRSWSAKERLSWYLNRLINNEGNYCADAVQYAERFGTQGWEINDVPNIPLNYAIAFNDLVQQKCTADITSYGKPLNFVLFDLSKVKQTFEDMPNATQVKLLEDVIKGNPGINLEDAFRLFRNILNSGQTTYVPPDRNPNVRPEEPAAAPSEKNNLLPIAAGVLILYKIFG